MFSTGVHLFKIIILHGFVLLIFFVSSCQPRQKHELAVPGIGHSPESDLIEIKYAKGFSIRHYPNYKIIENYD